MFYETTAKTHVRVQPKSLNLPLKEAIFDSLTNSFQGYISPEVGFVINVTEILKVGEGVIIHGDGAPYYNTEFKFITFVPEMQELIVGKITDITNFGAFLNMGPVDGMIHVSQTMDDYINFSKTKTLTGKQSKKVLKVGDKCKARVIAISYKDLTNPKIGLTMRQPHLGNINWVDEVVKKKVIKKGSKK